MAAQATIFVVDDDPAVSRALLGVGQLLGLPVQAFASAPEFLDAVDRTAPGCLVLDIKMYGMTGMELQQRLNAEGSRLPIIMISGHADVPTAVTAMTRGAVTLLEKPFRLDDLVAHIRHALSEDASERIARAERADIRARLEQLTPKEREVLDLLVAGSTNKQIAAQLNLSVRAVEDRRARLMKRMAAGSIAELVRMASQASAGR